MKKHFSFNRLLHKDKLMMVVSLILAIVIWVLVDVDQEVMYEDEIHNIPIQVKLSDYAEQQGLRIIDGANVTATVKVSGTRAELKGLKASDITITADATAYLYDGNDYPARLTVVSKKCDVIDVTGSAIVGAKMQDKSILIDLKRYVEKSFHLTELDEEQIRLSGLKSADNVRVISVMLDDESVKDGTITVYGPKVSVDNIDILSVDLSDQTVTQTDRFMAALKAYDKNGQEISDLAFTTPEGGEVGVVVRVVVYRNEHFTVNDIAHAPDGFDASSLYVSPPFAELGEISGEQSVLDSYIKDINDALSVDFDQWLAEGKMVAKTVPLKESEGVYLDRAEHTDISISLNVENYGNIEKTFALVLDQNVFIHCNDGVQATLLQDTLSKVVVCGPKALLKKINASNIRIDIDATSQADGYRGKVAVRPQIILPQENSGDLVWIYYGDNVHEVEYTLNKVEAVAETIDDEWEDYIESEE